ncbi:phytanoyl-CoA dioxygenase family protein [Arenicella xantha]|uniref:Phytanoyl-CoA dioxygenase PhyH n=1 Tax=Arenicella xantha TaxID=644221 RepID=A0A395JG92_9GAMM|nr:phytanoyl-CoA dioxygenase PhyH [Arenicella xantha]
MDGSLQRLKADFEREGFVILDSGIDESILDATVGDLQKHFGNDRDIPVHVPYSDPWRIQDAWHINQSVLAIATAPSVLEVLQSLYQKPPQPFQTLNFYKGTQQPVHSDSIHFNSEPFGAMCGVWMALEDIGPDQGPLIYYPGSHKLAEMNYADLDLEACEASYPQYLEKIQGLINEHKFQPEYGLLKKGQCLIWSANILHGGAVQHDRELTRKSQVTHYYLGKPKAWRPVQSAAGRFYFEPEVVRDVSGESYKYPEAVPTVTFVDRVKSAIRRRVLRLSE